jgi:hypothetical protein
MSHMRSRFGRYLAEVIDCSSVTSENETKFGACTSIMFFLPLLVLQEPHHAGVTRRKVGVACRSSGGQSRGLSTG